MVGRPAKSRLRSSPAPPSTHASSSSTAGNEVSGDVRSSKAMASARRAAAKVGKNTGGRAHSSAAKPTAPRTPDVEVVEDDEEQEEGGGVAAIDDAPQSPLTQDAVVVCSGPEALSSVTCSSDDGDHHEGEEDAQAGCAVVMAATCISSRASSCRGDDDEEEERPSQGQFAHPATTAARNVMCGGAPGTTGSSSPAAAAILKASGLAAYFTYGFQAALQHYADDLCGDAAEGGACEGGLSRRNASLLERSEETALSEKAESRSSSAATYDSDPTEDTHTTKSIVEHLLEPQSTSLFRAAPSSAAHSGKATSWTPAPASKALPSPAAPPPTRGAVPSKAALSDVFPTQAAEWTSGGAAACFREALRRAYACEDAVRQQQHDDADRQRSGCINALAQSQHASRGDDLGLEDSSGASKVKFTARVPRRANGKQQCNVVDVLYALEGHGEENKDTVMAASPSHSSTAAHVDPLARRVLQVMPPSQAHALHRSPNVLVDTILKHHREAQLKQRGDRHAEAQTAHLRRRYELPVLTEDVTRYAVLLLCLKRRPLRRSLVSVKETADGSSLPELESTPLSPVGGAPTQQGPSQMSGPPPAMTAPEVADGAPPYGEEGTLLYLKYPAPLLRTTSFAVEAVRLLKWLRTWRNNGTSSSSTSRGDGLPPSPPSGNASTAAGGGRRKKSGGASRPRKRSRQEATARAVGVVDVAVSAAAAPAPATAAVTQSTLDDVHRQAQVGQQRAEVQAKQEKRSAFMKFFGAAVVPQAVKAKDEAETDVAVTTASASPSAAVALPPQSPLLGDRKEEKEESIILQPPQRTALDTTAATVRTSHSSQTAQLCAPSPPSLGVRWNPAVYAYQLYCYAWRHAVKTGITPLATAAQAFAGAPSPHAPRAAWTDTAAPRACAALPFYKEMKGEAQRTALGSATRDVYYEDAYGNRLRSARLAQKEREKQEQLAAQQRRLAKKKGYFHRGDAEEAAGCRSAAAMLEAMRTPASLIESHADDRVGSWSGDRVSGRRKRGRRLRSSSSDAESSPVSISDAEGDDDDVVVAGPPKAARGRRARSTAASSDCSISSGSERSSSRSSSNSSSSRDDGPANADAAGAEDEITNIAVVSGPTGSGKTAAVYVAAQLLGFRVVEMNASVRRCSKTVELLLAELTRSYRLSALRPGASSFNAEEELTRLKQQHAAVLERAKAEAEAAEKEAEQRRREARKANGISAQAVASFFSRSSAGKSTAAAAAATTIVDDAADDAVAVAAAPAPATTTTTATGASPLSPPPPLPTSAAASPPPRQAPLGGARTLLLFEDADVLLGDESAKPFYAAIRDLAHRSKVPIVVTVSSDASPSQRYDVPPHAPAAAAAAAPSSLGAQTRVAADVEATYWQVCEAAGLNTAMDTLEAAYRALQASPVLDDRPAGAESTTNNSSSGGVGGDGGGTSPHTASGTASLASFFPSAKTAAGSASSSTAATGTSGGSSSSGNGVSPPSLPTGTAAAASVSMISSGVSSQPAARFTHILLNASLVSSFFGTRTPFTVVEALPTSALFAQLLTVGAVELDLFQWQTGPTSASAAAAAGYGGSSPPPPLPFSQQTFNSSGAGGPFVSPTPPSSSSWQHHMDHLTRRLVLRDTRLFFELVRRLCDALFGVTTDESSAVMGGVSDGGDGATDRLRQRGGVVAASRLSSAVRCDAAQRTTTDIRYWLNRLQLLLLDLRAQEACRAASASAEDAPSAKTGGASDASRRQTETVMEADNGKEPLGRQAERLLDTDFHQHTSLAASAWDSTLGRYRACLAHNEQQSSRQEYWLLDDHVDYVSDIIGELNEQDHPTRNIDYAPAKAAAAAAAPKRRGRPPSASSASSSARAKAVCVVDAAPATTAAVSAAPAAGGLRPAWKALFSGAAAGGASPPTTAATSTGGRADAPVLPGGQQTLFGAPPPASVLAAASALSAGLVAVDAARCTWPPTPAELRRQVNRSTSRLRPVHVVLPYSTAQTYYDVAATSAAAADLRRVPDVADPSPHLLGHDTALRFVNRNGGQETVAEEGDVADATRELPVSVFVTQAERAEVLRRWWRRTRKVGALRDHVVGRSAAALEEVLGHSCLLAPSSGSSGSGA